MSVSSLLADLGYDTGSIEGEMGNIELSIERFDPWSNRQNLPVTYICGGFQYSGVRAASA